MWLTGRPEWLRDVTADWLARHDLPGDELHLRPWGDYRPARYYKLDVLRSLAPRGIAAFVDDDEEVVDAAVAGGFPRGARRLGAADPGAAPGPGPGRSNVMRGR